MEGLAVKILLSIVGVLLTASVGLLVSLVNKVWTMDKKLDLVNERQDAQKVTIDEHKKELETLKQKLAL